MGGFSVSGLDDLIRDLDTLADIPDDVTCDMLEAATDVLVDAQKRSAEKMLKGPYSVGLIKSGLTKKRPKRNADGFEQVITFEGFAPGRKGKADNRRIATIAFINEYGKVNQPARPFIRTANDEKADEAAGVAAAVYDSYLKTKGL